MSGWTERNRWRKGRWLVVDDETGFVRYSDQVTRRWDGMIVDKRNDEPPDPQWFISAKSDPVTVPFIRPESEDGPACTTLSPYNANGTLRSPFPGYNQFVATGIGDFEIECSFVVYPDGGPFPPT